MSASSFRFAWLIRSLHSAPTLPFFEIVTLMRILHRVNLASVLTKSFIFFLQFIANTNHFCYFP